MRRVDDHDDRDGGDDDMDDYDSDDVFIDDDSTSQSSKNHHLLQTVPSRRIWFISIHLELYVWCTTHNYGGTAWFIIDKQVLIISVFTIKDSIMANDNY